MLSNNSSKASEFFKSKKKYDETFPVVNKNRLYDFWYDKPYFGKVNSKGITIYPKEEFLGNLDEQGQYKALDFVAEAFLDLQNFVRRSKERGVYPNDFLEDFSPKRAWKSLPVEYDKYFEDYIFNPFLNTYMLDKKIKTFDDFVNEYIRYARTVAPDVSITQNEFILGSNCTNKISGLIIDLIADDHGDNDLKAEEYLRKFEYLNFINPCRNFGFRINKHAPWQLIADLTTEENNPMQKYAEDRNVSLKDNSFFETYYYTASEIDFNNFKRYLYILYTSYYSVNSTYDKIKVSLSSMKYGSPLFSDYKTKITKELPVEMPARTYDEFQEKYGDEYFLKLYFKIRLIENSKEHRYTDLVYNVQSYYSLGGTTQALEYIDSKLINSKIYTEKDKEVFFFA